MGERHPGLGARTRAARLAAEIQLPRTHPSKRATSAQS